MSTGYVHTHARMHARTHTHTRTQTNKKKEWDAGLMHHCRGTPRLNGEVPGNTQGTSNLHSRCRPDLLIHHGHSQSMDHRYLKERHISTLCPALDTSSKQTNKNAHDIYTAIPDLFQKTTSSKMSWKTCGWCETKGLTPLGILCPPSSISSSE